jgi:NAD(P)-dependent dehydrogenase (short-subunit alcohol dehydrogenase family)
MNRLQDKEKALLLMPYGASIILNASIAATKGIPSFSVYAPTKAAIRSFARGWIVDLRARGIRVKRSARNRSHARVQPSRFCS